MLIVGSSRQVQIIPKFFFFKSLCNCGAAVFLFATVVELRRRKLKKDEELFVDVVRAERMMVMFEMYCVVLCCVSGLRLVYELAVGGGLPVPRYAVLVNNKSLLYCLSTGREE